ncbi:uncharacterized protein [Aegilops tauschii subsp. strangulata]|uniref:uncharacterized protein n=1 Tax=Aegilops tauschii subsp. strangulata TaxID=200361 RepID=UPI003CC8C7F4
MWAIWTSRNNITHDKASLDLLVSMKKTREALAILELPRVQARTLPGFGWHPPNEGCIKINTDAGISMEARLANVGGIACSSSAFIRSWCKPVHGVTDTLVVEAMALREAVVFAKLHGFERVEMETDSKEVVHLRNSRRSSRSLIALVLLDIEELPASFEGNMP